MWYKTGVLCGLLLALLVHSSRADVDCDGLDDLIGAGLTLGTVLTPSAFTVAVWVRSTGSTFPDSGCLGGGTWLGDTEGYLAVGRRAPDGAACAYLWDGAHQTLAAAMGAGWHHMAVRLSGGTYSLWVDGVNAHSVATGAIEDVGYPWSFCGAGGAYSPDRLTDLRLFPSALPDAELETLGKSRLRLPPRTAPSGYWPLTDCPDGASGGGVGFTDRSGFGRTITGNTGANTTGLTCRASEWLSQPMPIQ